MTDNRDMPFTRWIVDVFYKSMNGTVDVRHHVEEIHELDELIERGPSFKTIERIEINLARRPGEPVQCLPRPRIVRRV